MVHETPPRAGPWRTVEDVELATLAWVHWFNNERLHSSTGDIPPVEFEEAHHAQLAANELVETEYRYAVVDRSRCRRIGMNCSVRYRPNVSPVA